MLNKKFPLNSKDGKRSPDVIGGSLVLQPTTAGQQNKAIQDYSKGMIMSHYHQICLVWI